MAWPPQKYPAPADQANATSQLDRHPTDHAETDLAINDLVERIQALEAVFDRYTDAPHVRIKPPTTGGSIKFLTDGDMERRNHSNVLVGAVASAASYHEGLIQAGFGDTTPFGRIPVPLQRPTSKPSGEYNPLILANVNYVLEVPAGGRVQGLWYASYNQSSWFAVGQRHFITATTTRTTAGGGFPDDQREVNAFSYIPSFSFDDLPADLDDLYLEYRLAYTDDPGAPWYTSGGFGTAALTVWY